MKSAVEKNGPSSLVDTKRGISLEHAFWDQLKEIARAKECTLSKLVAQIDAGRLHGNLLSEIRLFVLLRPESRVRDTKAPASDEEHTAASARAATART